MSNRNEVFPPLEISSSLVLRKVKSAAPDTASAFCATKTQRSLRGRGFDFFFNVCLLPASPSVVAL